MQNFGLVREALGKNVRSLRKGQDLTQAGLAEKARLHRTYVADIERGARNVSLENIHKIADALEVSISELCRDIDVAGGHARASARQVR